MSAGIATSSVPDATADGTGTRRPLPNVDVGPLEEESLPGYHEGRYYPVHVGDVFEDRYETLGKLGYGATSTTWLCRDRDEEDYKVVKICVHESGITLREQEAYDHMAGLETANSGLFCLRQLEDDFDIIGPSGYEHHCFVFAPAACNVAEISERLVDRDIGLIKWIVRCTLRALDFLHSDAHIIHTDVKPDNILLSLSDQDVLDQYVQDLNDVPPQQKTILDSDRVIYRSRELKDLGQSRWHVPLLADLGEARIANIADKLQEPATISAPAMRAPEAILGMKWGYAVDIWSVGCMFFMLLNDDLLFHNKPGQEPWSACWHLTQMAALMGRPPAGFLERIEQSTLKCSGSCTWQNADTGGDELPALSFETLLDKLGVGEKALALDFVRCIFKWKPEDRSTAKQLLEHPFMEVVVINEDAKEKQSDEDHGDMPKRVDDVEVSVTRVTADDPCVISSHGI